MQTIRLFASVIKILLNNFSNNFRNFISYRGLSPDHYWNGCTQEIGDFRGFGSISQRVFDILHEIFFCGKILPSSFDKHQKFDNGCSSYPGNEAESPDFGRF